MYNNLNLSEGASKAIKLAGEIALRFGSYQVGTEHILYGLTAVEDSLSSKVLKSFGITKKRLEDIFLESTDEEFLKMKVELTPRSKDVIKIASSVALQLNHSFIGTEHILFSLMSSPDSFAVKLMNAYFSVSHIQIRNKILIYLQGSAGFSASETDFSGAGQMDQSIQTGSKSLLPEKLLELGVDVTQKAKDQKIDPIIGRESEIEKIIEILCRKTKNNPVLIGEAGVGKTAVVEGLALAIVAGNVPELLKNKLIYSLDIGSLMSGTKYRGSMEERLKEVISIIINNKDIIVFIDEIHTLAQAGSEKGEVSPADMLKPYLSRGEMQTIGATTTEEYRKYIEKDKALERRFQPVMINPPTIEQTIEILKGLRDSFEAFHKVKITDEAIDAAVNMSDRYIVDRNLPDKAIDLIDQASSKVKLNFSIKPHHIREKEEKIKQLSANRDEASYQRNYEKAAKFQSEIAKFEEELKQYNLKISKNPENNSNSITANEIANVVSSWTGIPVTKITETEKEKLINLEDILHKRVVGQEEAVSAVAKAIRRSRVGLQDSKRPIGSFLFLGPTGVGKTELSKAIAEAMFDSEKNIIRLDMSEYMESHSVSKLFGAPPGYIGYDEGGQLTEQVRRKPYSVVLFDEIEKAHTDVFNALLQILDDGRLTDGQGRTINFRNTIIILTSNVGSGEVRAERKSLGFGENNKLDELSYESQRKIYMESLKKKFRPEFLNRIDIITVFHNLTKEDLTKIATIMVSDLDKRLSKTNLKIQITEDALNSIVNFGSDGEYGARPLKRYIQQQIEDRIAEKILLGELEKEGTIVIDYQNNELTFVMG